MAHQPNDATELADVPPAAYRPGDRLARARLWLPLAAVAVLAACGVADYAVRRDERYTPAPLASVHASWDSQCAACHVDAAPLGGNNWAAVVLGQTHGADVQCKQCHASAPHHARERVEDVPGCATCHAEHRGRQAALTRVGDALCTSCHGDLPSHARDTTVGRLVSSVTAFNVEDHPGFGPERGLKDPGTVAFNHQLHLRAGLGRTADPAMPFTLAQLAPEQRDAYRRWAHDDGVVQLDCAACHQPDGGAMRPIVFETHCQACHPLTIARPARANGPADLVTVRHHLRPNEIEATLRGHYTAQFLLGRLAVKPTLLTRPLPGKNPLRPDETQTARTLIEKHVSADQVILLGPSTCQKCHTSLAHDRRRIEPARIPRVWLPHARFDHAAHQPVATCLDCHAGARASQLSSDVLLPGIATCVQCHAPAQGRGETVHGGARVDCAECHRYHGGDLR